MPAREADDSAAEVPIKIGFSRRWTVIDLRPRLIGMFLGSLFELDGKLPCPFRRSRSAKEFQIDYFQRFREIVRSVHIVGSEKKPYQILALIAGTGPVFPEASL